jgi:hypothetical protein
MNEGRPESKDYLRVALAFLADSSWFDLSRPLALFHVILAPIALFKQL